MPHLSTGNRSARARAGDPHGFTFIELLVALAIMLMVAAIIAPPLLGMLDRERVNMGVDSMQSLIASIGEFEADTDRYPGFLDQLPNTITTSMRNSCDGTYINPEVNRWAGPYLDRFIPTTGIPIGIGRAMNPLVREPAVVAVSGRASKKSRGAVNTASGTLALVVEGVREEDAFEVEAEIDGDGLPGAGTIQFTETTDGFVELYYVIPIAGC